MVITFPMYVARYVSIALAALLVTQSAFVGQVTTTTGYYPLNWIAASSGLSIALGFVSLLLWRSTAGRIASLSVAALAFLLLIDAVSRMRV
jgi:hypothetical protein